MTISQLFVLAPNGHTIVHKDYRGDTLRENLGLPIPRVGG